MSVAIIGSGFAGMAAAHGLGKLRRPAIIYESAPHWGGHTHTDRHQGFSFDEGPHVSFTKDERVMDVFAQGAVHVEEVGARITNWFQGSWVTHPAQVHLHGLDPGLVTECIADFVEATNNPPTVKTYADWLVAMYGRTFAENFPFRYTRKYWTVEPADLGVDWIGKRMYPPKLTEMLRGALTPDNRGDFHYLKTYRYPSSGGYQSFMNELARGVNIRVGSGVVSVNPANKTLRLTDDSQVEYDQLISTMPLDQLVARLDGVNVPDDVQAAANELLCTSVVLVEIGVERADLFDHEWFYVYDEDISPARVHFPHMLAPGNAPLGRGSIQAEVYFSRRKSLGTVAAELPRRVVEEFIAMGILKSHEEVIFARHRTIDYANVVFDHRREPALAKIKPFIADLGIVLAGRFGEWDYHWTDDATNAGWRAAASLGDTDVHRMLSGGV